MTDRRKKDTAAEVGPVHDLLQSCSFTIFKSLDARILDFYTLGIF